MSLLPFSLLFKHWKYGAAVVGILGAFLLGINQGADYVSAKWAKESLKQAEVLRVARETANTIRTESNQEILQRAIERDIALSEANQMRAENDQLRARRPIVKTVQVDGQCHYPDVSRWVLDFNASASPRALPIASETRPHPVPVTHHVTTSE